MGFREVNVPVSGHRATDDLVARRGTVLDVQNEGRWFNAGLLLAPAPSRLTAISLSRPLLEGYLRERVAALPGVSLHARTEVLGLMSGAARNVTGVRIPRDGRAQDVPADLVVDASGRGNRGPTWLKELGYEQALENWVDPISSTRRGPIVGARRTRTPSVSSSGRPSPIHAAQWRCGARASGPEG